MRPRLPNTRREADAHLDGHRLRRLAVAGFVHGTKGALAQLLAWQRTESEVKQKSEEKKKKREREKRRREKDKGTGWASGALATEMTTPMPSQSVQRTELKYRPRILLLDAGNRGERSRLHRSHHPAKTRATGDTRPRKKHKGLSRTDAEDSRIFCEGAGVSN